MDIDKKLLSIDKQLSANMVSFTLEDPDQYIVLKTCVGIFLLMAVISVGMFYLVDRKNDSVNQFILKHDCKPVEILRIDAIEAHIIYQCGDGKQLEVTL